MLHGLVPVSIGVCAVEYLETTDTYTVPYKDVFADFICVVPRGEAVEPREGEAVFAAEEAVVPGDQPGHSAAVAEEPEGVHLTLRGPHHVSIINQLNAHHALIKRGQSDSFSDLQIYIVTVCNVFAAS